jgi:hypothetical protein
MPSPQAPGAHERRLIVIFLEHHFLSDILSEQLELSGLQLCQILCWQDERASGVTAYSLNLVRTLPECMLYMKLTIQHDS